MRDTISRRWEIKHLWAPASVLIIGFVVTAHVLSQRLNHVAENLGTPGTWVRDTYLSGTALVGLGLVFVLYTLWLFLRVLDTHRRAEEQAAGLARLRERLSGINDLFRTATQLDLHYSVDDVVNLLLERLCHALDAREVAVQLINPQNHRLETALTYLRDAEHPGERGPGERISRWVSMLSHAESREEFSPPDFPPEQSAPPSFAAALQIGEVRWGTLRADVTGHSKTFGEEEHRVLELFAEHLGAVLHRSHVMEVFGDRTRSLEEANERLTDINKIKDAFLSTASHELKTPLTTIIGYSEILSTHDETLDTEQRSEFLERLRAEARGLLGIIDGIIDLSRLETGKSPLNLEEASINDIAHSAAETVATLAEKKGIEIDTDLESEVPRITVDWVKVRQVLVNLLVNAVRYSPDKAPVLLRSRREEDSVVLTVIDRGPGIPPEDRERIFALFGQGVRRGQTSTTGLGIGLNLVKRIVELHHGEVGVMSQVGEGSEFWIRLPLDHQATGSDRAAA